MQRGNSTSHCAAKNVGLGYIKLGQNSSTLSGGENQRVKLASYFVGNSTSPVLFIFDEPTTGLHVHDINVLMQTFDALIDAGHSLVIVEYNLDIIKRADYVIDLGPRGEETEGGNLVYQGTPEGLMEVEESYTGRYLEHLGTGNEGEDTALHLAESAIRQPFAER